MRVSAWWAVAVCLAALSMPATASAIRRQAVQRSNRRYSTTEATSHEDSSGSTKHGLQFVSSSPSPRRESGEKIYSRPRTRGRPPGPSSTDKEGISQQTLQSSTEAFISKRVYSRTRKKPYKEAVVLENRSDDPINRRVHSVPLYQPNSTPTLQVSITPNGITPTARTQHLMLNKETLVSAPEEQNEKPRTQPIFLPRGASTSEKTSDRSKFSRKAGKLVDRRFNGQNVETTSEMTASGSINQVTVMVKEPTTVKNTNELRNDRKLRFKSRQSDIDTNLTGQGVVIKQVSSQTGKDSPSHQEVSSSTQRPAFRLSTQRSSTSKEINESIDNNNSQKARQTYRFRHLAKSTQSDTAEVSDDDNYPESFKALLQAKASTQSGSHTTQSLAALQQINYTVKPSLTSSDFSGTLPRYIRHRRNHSSSFSTKNHNGPQIENNGPEKILFGINVEKSEASPIKSQFTRPESRTKTSSYLTRLRKPVSTTEVPPVFPQEVSSQSTDKPHISSTIIPSSTIANEEDESIKQLENKLREISSTVATLNKNAILRKPASRPFYNPKARLISPKPSENPASESNGSELNNISSKQKTRYHAKIREKNRLAIKNETLSSTVSTIKNLQRARFVPMKSEKRKEISPNKIFQSNEHTTELHSDLSGSRINSIAQENDKYTGRYSSKYRAPYNIPHPSTSSTVTPITAWLRFFVTDTPLTGTYNENTNMNDEEIMMDVTPHDFDQTMFNHHTDFALDHVEENQLGSDINILSYTQTRRTLASADLKLSETRETPSQLINVETLHHSPSVTVSIFDALADILTSTPKNLLSSTTEVTQVAKQENVMQIKINDVSTPSISESSTQSNNFNKMFEATNNKSVQTAGAESNINTSEVTLTSTTEDLYVKQSETTASPTPTTPLTVTERRPFATLVLFSTTEQPSTDSMTTFPQPDSSPSTEGPLMVFNTVSDLILSDNNLISSQLTSMLSNNLMNVLSGMDVDSRNKVSVNMASILKSIIPKALESVTSSFDESEPSTTPFDMEDIIATELNYTNIIDVYNSSFNSPLNDVNRNLKIVSYSGDVSTSIENLVGENTKDFDKKVVKPKFLESSTVTVILDKQKQERNDIETLGSNISVPDEIDSENNSTSFGINNTQITDSPVYLDSLHTPSVNNLSETQVITENIVKNNLDILNATFKKITEVPDDKDSNNLTSAIITEPVHHNASISSRALFNSSSLDLSTKSTVIANPTKNTDMSMQLWLLSRKARVLKLIEDIINQHNAELVTTTSPFRNFPDNVAPELFSNRLNELVKSFSMTSTTEKTTLVTNPVEQLPNSLLMNEIEGITKQASFLDSITTTDSIDVPTTPSNPDFMSTQSTIEIESTTNNDKINIESVILQKNPSDQMELVDPTESLTKNDIYLTTNYPDLVSTVNEFNMNVGEASTMTISAKNTTELQGNDDIDEVSLERPIFTRKPPKKDYVIFGILPNNTVIRKDPNEDILETLTEASPYIVYGVLPNNTIIRKFPNGTRVPKVLQRVDVVPISPWSLKNPYSPIHNNPAIVKPNPIHEITNIDENIRIFDGSVNTLTGFSVNNPLPTTTISPQSLYTIDKSAPVTKSSNLSEVKGTSAHVVSLRTSTMLPSIDEILLNSISLAAKEEQLLSSMTSSTTEPPILTLDIDPETKQIRTEKPDDGSSGAVFKFIPIDRVPAQNEDTNVLKLSMRQRSENKTTTPKLEMVDKQTNLSDFFVTPRNDQDTTTVTFSAVETDSNFEHTTTLQLENSVSHLTDMTPTNAYPLPKQNTPQITSQTAIAIELATGSSVTTKPIESPQQNANSNLDVTEWNPTESFIATTSKQNSLTTNRVVESTTTETPTIITTTTTSSTTQNILTAAPMSSSRIQSNTPLPVLSTLQEYFTNSGTTTSRLPKTLPTTFQPLMEPKLNTAPDIRISTTTEPKLTTISDIRISTTMSPVFTSRTRPFMTTPKRFESSTLDYGINEIPTIRQAASNNVYTSTQLPTSTFSAQDDIAFLENLRKAVNKDTGDAETDLANRIIALAVERSLVDIKNVPGSTERQGKAISFSSQNNKLTFSPTTSLPKVAITSTTTSTTTTTTTTPKSITTTPKVITTEPSIEEDIKQFQQDAKLLQALLQATGQDPSKFNLPTITRAQSNVRVSPTTTASNIQDDLKFLSNLLGPASPLNEPFDSLTPNTAKNKNVEDQTITLNVKPLPETTTRRTIPTTQRTTPVPITTTRKLIEITTVKPRPTFTSRTTTKTEQPTEQPPSIQDDIKSFQEDAKLLQTLLKLQGGDKNSALKNKIPSTGLTGGETLATILNKNEKGAITTSTPIKLSTEYGKTNDALLAALLKEQGFGPTTASSLDEQLRLAALLNQVVVTPKPRLVTTPLPPPPPPPPQRRPVLDGLAWLWQQWRDTAPGPGAPASRGSRRPSVQETAPPNRVNWFGSGPFVGNAPEPTTGNRIPLEPPSVVSSGGQSAPARGQLVAAAINVTRAFSQFLGAAIQGAAQTVQSVIRAGTRATADQYGAGSG